MVVGTFGSFEKDGPTKLAEHSTLTAGIDTAKDKLDIAIVGQLSSLQVPNSLVGWQQMAAYLTKVGVGCVDIEATGGYEHGVRQHLEAEGFMVTLLQPLQVKSFAKLHLKRAKSDRIDAALIAACTAFLGDQGKITSAPRFNAWQAHLTFIEQIEDDIVRIKTRQEHTHNKRQRRINAADLRRLQARRTAEMDRLIKDLSRHADLARCYELVLSIPGIGPRTALAIILRIPELGQISREKAAALAGLTPFVQQSGK
jgi:transposase